MSYEQSYLGCSRRPGAYNVRAHLAAPSYERGGQSLEVVTAIGGKFIVTCRCSHWWHDVSHDLPYAASLCILRRGTPRQLFYAVASEEMLDILYQSNI